MPNRLLRNMEKPWVIKSVANPSKRFPFGYWGTGCDSSTNILWNLFPSAAWVLRSKTSSLQERMTFCSVLKGCSHVERDE